MAYRNMPLQVWQLTCKKWYVNFKPRFKIEIFSRIATKLNSLVASVLNTQVGSFFLFKLIRIFCVNTAPSDVVVN